MIKFGIGVITLSIVGKISRVAGPFITARGMTGSRMYELVRVGEADVIGEIIRLQEDIVSILYKLLWDSKFI